MQVVRSDIRLQSSDFRWYTKLMQDVSEFQIYKRAIELLPPIYELADTLPRSERELRSQLCNAAKSISAQIAEGFGKKNSQVEFKRFLYMALGSSDETITHLRQIDVLRLSDGKSCTRLIEAYRAESKQINALIQTIKHRIADV